MNDLPEKREEQTDVANKADLTGAVSNYEKCAKLAQQVHDSGLAPDGHSNVQTTAVCMMLAYELGLHPMKALTQVYVVHGRPSLSAQAMRGLVYRHRAGTFETKKGKDEKLGRWVEITGKRADNGDTLTAKWSEARAKKSGLGGNAWNNYPIQMLQNRATAEVCRQLFPDIVGGLYPPDEVESIDDDEQEPIQGAEAQVIDSLGLQPDQDGDVPDAPRKALGNGTEDTTEGEGE